ncbi:Hypothetical predicted protein [Mytilus galloprovincialis]|uniref:Secreted protein n=1 Tax=Mytilus galloprovincialis TaxID=29158 RepID=A0A8B6CCL9_MYTGA|nr:Hypothetical predicted protein [Mytilus galloprovincialis]
MNNNNLVNGFKKVTSFKILGLIMLAPAALCNGKPTPLGGCTEKNPTDAIQYRGGGSRNEGGGTCISPGQCADCKDGFYVDGALCTTLCNGKPTPLGGCSEVNPTDTIKYRGGGSRNQGEGTCISPGLCSNCKDGFYADWALCTSKKTLSS